MPSEEFMKACEAKAEKVHNDDLMRLTGELLDYAEIASNRNMALAIAAFATAISACIANSVREDAIIDTIAAVTDLIIANVARILRDKAKREGGG